MMSTAMKNVGLTVLRHLMSNTTKSVSTASVAVIPACHSMNSAVSLTLEESPGEVVLGLGVAVRRPQIGPVGQPVRPVDEPPGPSFSVATLP